MREEQQRLIEQGKAQLQAVEAEKRMLYDRTIGDPSMPRPSVNFIKENVGKPKSQAQTDKEAFAHIYPKMNQKAADAWLVKNTPATPTPPINLREAWNANDRQQTSQKQTTPKEQLREAWNAADRQSAPQTQTTSQEKLREAWNAKADPSRVKQRDKQRERGGQER